MKKKLLFVLHSLTVGGAEMLVVQMAESLKEEYEIGILCLDKKGELWDRCKESGFWLGELQRSPGLSFSNFTRAANLISSFSPDIIHAHQYAPFLFSAVSRMLGKTKAKIIFTEHGRHFPDQVSLKRRLANKLLSSYADRITGVSEFSTVALKDKEGFGDIEMKVVYNGLKFDELKRVEDKSICDELRIDPSRKLIGFVGSLRPVKNPQALLKAFVEVSKLEKEVDLVFIGDGPLKGDLEDLARNRRVGDKVHFAGIRIPASPYFNNFKVFVQPSFSEACSLALLEAMYRNVPVIVSDGGGGPELVENGRTGKVVAVDDIKGLVDALLEILRDPNESARLATAARQRVETEFGFDSMLSSYSEIYRSCL